MARPYIIPSKLHNRLLDKRPSVAEEETESHEHTGAPLRGQESNRGRARFEHRQSVPPPENSLVSPIPLQAVAELCCPLSGPAGLMFRLHHPVLSFILGFSR